MTEKKGSSCAVSEVGQSQAGGEKSNAGDMTPASRWKKVASTLGKPSEPAIKQFRWIEAMVLRLVFMAVQLKVEKIMFKQRSRDDKNAMQESIELVQDTMKIFTMKGLARHIVNKTPNYFGFETINVMQHDLEHPNQLYTITFGDEEERKVALEAAIKKAKTDQQKQDLRDKEAISDYVVAEESMIKYPVTTGIVSRVYQNHETIYYNNFTTFSDFDFVSEIDNPRGIKNIENVHMCPMIRDDGSCNGVLQLFNKTGMISAFDSQRLVSLGKLFGGRLEGIEDRMKQVMQNFSIALYHGVPMKNTANALNFMLRDGPERVYEDMIKVFSDVQLMDLEYKS